ncbi:MAE_28990/MAE_18760 family HEPN-like nuclease [Desulfoluna sp.]|uniref:MAE_28990/MAE_18760 family HEPN-like nuclease n=1 Tax=Desulfoluna sp. TaxID=2045199 RepID=UPI00262C178D|nr:MAE_28990/MAE_18760 family HEPN-like nuclease [Desulfoluna sp.]
MKLRTVDQLSNRINDELAWRKKELSDLKYIIESGANNISRRNVASRCGIALLYAHWEGFVKKCTQYYFEFVQLKKLKNNQLSPHLLTLSLKGKINFSPEAKKASAYNEIINFFLNEVESRAILPHKTGISTESNLTSTVLKEILWCIDIDYSLFEAKEKFIDMVLVNKRNTIAHGEDLIIDVAEYIEMRTVVVGMMSLLKTEIENNAVLESYLK